MAAAEKQIHLTVDVEKGKVTVVSSTGGIMEPRTIDPKELIAANVKYVGVLYHQRRNPSCFYFDYLGSIFEICF